MPFTTGPGRSAFLPLACLLLILCLGAAPSAHAAGTVTAWGDNRYGQTNVPAGLNNMVAVAAREYHSLALRADGTVVAWGNNTSGQTNVPAGLNNAVAVAAGSFHSLALRADGTVAAWGWNGDGQTNVPAGLSNVVAVAAGANHSLALRADGAVAAWGQNSSGQTNVPVGLSNLVAVAGGGNHSLALRADGTVAAWGAAGGGVTTVPVGLSNVVAVAGGEYHSLALRGDGTVAAWGNNSYGQTTVPVGLSNVVAVAAGNGYSLALRGDGTVAAWGNNSYGQTNVPAGMSNVVAVATGGDRSLALVGLPRGLAAPQLVGSRFLIGTVDWPFQYRIMALNGAAAYGASGLPPGVAVNPSTGLITGQPSRSGTYAVVLSATNALGSDQWTVTLVVNLPLPGVGDGLIQAVLGSGFNHRLLPVNEPVWLAAYSLPAGLAFNPSSGVISGVPLELGDFPVSVLASNRYGVATGWVTIRVSPVAAWGANDYGQTNVPAGLSNLVAVAAGWAHCLALRADGTVAAWGASAVPAGLSNVVAVAAGASHSLALRADGTVAAWGQNWYGQATVPVGLSNVVAVAAGGGHSLALRADGAVAAWGDNQLGQTTVPSGLSNVVAVAAGGDHSLALKANRTVVAWGDNYYGQTNVPAGLSNVVAVAAGGYHNLALRADGTVAAWGKYWNGTTYVPMTVPAGLSNVVAVAAGGGHNLALRADGNVIAWGANDYGQTTVPAGLSNVVAVAAGADHSLALVGLPGGLAAPQLVGSRVLIGTVDRPFQYRIMALNGATSYGAGNLPPGLAMDPSTGLVTGQPSQAGTYAVVLSVTNALGTGQRVVTLVVNLPLPGVVGGEVSTRVGITFSYQLVTVNDPIWFAASGLPDGLAIHPATGMISGIPLEPGVFRVSVLASNRHGISTGFVTISLSPLAAWGDNRDGQTNVPADLYEVVAVAAGTYHSLALRADGTVAAWGASAVPAGLSNVVAVAAGPNYNLALQANGTVAAWGYYYNGSSNVLMAAPAGLSNVVAVAAGWDHCLALRADGTVAAWGRNSFGQTTVPAGLSNVVAVAAGISHSLASRADGTVAAWGYNGYGQTTVPAGLSNVVAVAAGTYHSLALRADGTVAAWGRNWNGTTYIPMAVPAGLSNVVAVAAGARHSLVLISAVANPVQIVRQPSSQTVFPGANASLFVLARGLPPLRYQWRFNGANIASATNTAYTIANVQSDRLGEYSVVVANRYGSVTSQVARLTVPSTNAPTAFNLRDYYHPIYPGNHWTYDSKQGSSSWTTLCRIDAVNLPLTCYTGRNPVSSYTRSVNSVYFDQGAERWTNYLAAGDEGWGYVGTDHDGGQPRMRFDAGFVFTNRMSLGQTISQTNDIYANGVYSGQGTLAVHLIDLVDVSVPAGSFTGCLHLETTSTIGGRTTVDEAWWAKGTGPVRWTHGEPGATSLEVNELRTASFVRPPRITVPPQSQLVSAGSTVNFSVGAMGDTPLSYQWRRNGTNLVGGGNLSGVTTTNLVITNVQTNNAGSYAVVVTNAYGSVTSQVAILTLDDGSPWARRVARTSLTNDELAMGLTTDSAGNLYVAGWFDRANDFGGTVLTSYGGQDAFIAKYNSNGLLQWVRQAGGTNVEPMNTDYWDHARAVGVDAAGNVYAAGGFLGRATFSGTVLTSLNNQDAFLAKYNAAGQLQWVRQGGNASGQTYATGIAVDAAGTSLVVGYFDGPTASFDGITATNASSHYAAFLVKYDSTGTALWARGLGGGQTYSTTVGLDAAGNCYVAGGFKGTLYLGTINLTSAGDKDGFLAKFNSVGVLQWARQAGGTGTDEGRLGVDAAGNSWFVGNFTGSTSFGTTNLTSPSGYGLFVARYDTSGNLQWARQADSASFLATEGGCAIDAAGNCYIPGVYTGTADFGGTVVTNRGGWDIFVAKYDSAGNLKWVQTGGGTGNDGAFKMAVDTVGNCYLAGWFQGTALIGTNTLTAQGYWDTFVARITPPTKPWLQFKSLSGSNGSFQMRLDGTPGVSVIVDTSFSLTNWTPWQTNALPTGGLPLVMPMGTNRHQFFKARIP